MVLLAGVFRGPCTLDFTKSTDVKAIPTGVDLQAPVTATWSGPGGPYITLLVDAGTGVIVD